MSYNVKIFFNSFKCNSLNISTQEIYDLEHFHNYGHICGYERRVSRIDNCSMGRKLYNTSMRYM